MITAKQLEQALAQLEGIAAALSKKAQQAPDSEVGRKFAYAAAECWAMQPILKKRYDTMLKEEPQYRKR